MRLRGRLESASVSTFVPPEPTPSQFVCFLPIEMWIRRYQLDLAAFTAPISWQQKRWEILIRVLPTRCVLPTTRGLVFKLTWAKFIPFQKFTSGCTIKMDGHTVLKVYC